MKTKKFREINLPQYKDSKYIVIEGQVYFNASAEPGAPILGRFIYSTEEWAGRRGR